MMVIMPSLLQALTKPAGTDCTTLALGAGVAAGAQADMMSAAAISTARPLKAFQADEREFWVIISSFGSMGQTVTVPVPGNGAIRSNFGCRAATSFRLASVVSESAGTS